ncbi:MAG: hypothetical protein B7Y90_12740 [Alphaproteobacteria bacterium 32-64-14]|nr:MAG: hypothetical protein B7Y90_12740 [Alphaproteobacteria bacterium 32-64-14]
MGLVDKLKILADAAKYDASCSSSGGKARDSKATRGIGSNEGVGSCEALPVFVTAHPSYLLRIPDAAAKEQEYVRFVAEPAEAKALATPLLAA